MRDRETDSWWSIMTSNAIGGALDGRDLRELPVSEKATWKEWRERYPATRVLSVDGVEHIENNPYDHYFTSEGTFRDLQIDDDRLAPKTPIYSFWAGDRPVAVPHERFVGGAVLTGEGADERWLLYREPDASIFASSRAYRLRSEVEAEVDAELDAAKLIERIDAGADGIAEPLSGFDTFWYNWVAVHPDTLVLD